MTYERATVRKFIKIGQNFLYQRLAFYHFVGYARFLRNYIGYRALRIYERGKRFGNDAVYYFYRADFRRLVELNGKPRGLEIELPVTHTRLFTSSPAMHFSRG